MPDAHLRVFRGSPGEEGRFDEFDVPVEEGMVVLDALHWIQGHEAPDLAVRWNCKAAKCGSCSAEVDGRPRLTCKTRLSDFDLDEPITVEPMRAFPLVRDLVTDVSWNYEVNKTIQPFTPPDRRPPGGLALAAGGHRAGPGIPQVHRVLPVPGRLPRPAQPRDGASRSWARASSSGRRAWRCTRSTRRTGASTSRTAAGSATATSPSAAPRSARSTSRSPTTRSSRSRSGSPTRTTTRSSGPGASSAAAGRRRASGRAAGAPGKRRCRRTRPPDRPDPGARLSDTLFPDLAVEPDDRAPSGGGRRGFVIRTDGAARGNPGPASLGAALYDLARPDARDDRAVPDASISDYLGIQTNNVAEYTGRRPGARARPELGAREVHLLLDSKLIVEQLAGRWRVKDAKLIPLWTAARQTLAGFERWSAAHVPRAQNSVADALANEAIDRAQRRRPGLGRPTAGVGEAARNSVGAALSAARVMLDLGRSRQDLRRMPMDGISEA